MILLCITLSNIAIVQSVCSVEESVFPKYFGGNNDNTYINHIEIDPNSGGIVVGGISSDTEFLAGYTSGALLYQKPIVIYIDRQNVIVWKIYLNYEQRMSAMKLSNDGSLIVGVLENSPLKLIFIKAQDGTVYGALEESPTPLAMDRESLAC